MIDINTNCKNCKHLKPLFGSHKGAPNQPLMCCIAYNGGKPDYENGTCYEQPTTTDEDLDSIDWDEMYKEFEQEDFEMRCDELKEELEEWEANHDRKF